MRGPRALMLTTALAVALAVGTAGAGATPVTKVERARGWIEALAFNTVKGTADVGNVAFVPLSRVIAAVS